MTTSAPAYVRHPEGQKILFKEYSELSLEDWHKKHNEFVEWTGGLEIRWM